MSADRPLPPRTLQYIASGAPEGQRNEELLAAACQCRDAGRVAEKILHQLGQERKFTIGRFNEPGRRGNERALATLFYHALGIPGQRTSKRNGAFELVIVERGVKFAEQLAPFSVAC